MLLTVGCLLTSPVWVLAKEEGTKDPAVFIAAGSSIMVAELLVEIEGSEEDKSYYTDMAKQLITVRAGEPLDETALKESLEALKLSNRFSHVHVDLSTEPDGETLTFSLTPFLYVEDIRIHGEYPLFERDVLNQMTIYPGDPFNEKDFSRHAEAISNLYRREGYIDPKVSLSHELGKERKSVLIDVYIEKGPHYSPGKLTLKGNRWISSAVLKWQMQIWRASLVRRIGRFSEHRLKEDIENLLKYYRRRGHADASLSYKFSAPDSANRVDVTLTIDEGARYKVSFEGNKEFWDLTLRKDIVLSSIGNKSNIGVRRSTRNIRNRYQLAGYLDARITSEVTDKVKDSKKTRALRFIIHEGPQTVVASVTISGNEALSEKEIKDQMLTRPPSLFHDGAFVPDTLEEDVYAVTGLYMNRGFADRDVRDDVYFSDDRSEAKVTLDIEEGPQTKVGTISFTGSAVLPEKEMRNLLEHTLGGPFREPTVETEKQAITSFLAEKGYIHAGVRPHVTVDETKNRADIVYDIQPGTRVSLGRIFIAGNLRTKEKVIRRELEVEPGTPLSLKTLQKGQRQLRDQAIFHSVDYRTLGLREKRDTVNLFVDVEESKPYYVQFSTGYESDRGLFGRAMAGDRNLFGLNKDLWATGEISETGYRLETRFMEPRFFRTRIKTSVGLSYEELTEFNQPFGTRTFGASLGFGREWGRWLTTALSFRLEQREQFEVESDPDITFEDERRTIFVTTPFVQYDSRDSFIRPTKGAFASLGVDISKGVENQLDDFIRYSFDTRYYYTPVKRMTLACMARLGQVVPYSESELVPDDQLFFLGGIRDVRGFDQNLLRYDSFGNPVGGKTAIVGSVEARFDLGLNVELTCFFDIGSVQDALVDEGTEAFRPSAGLGLRYITPIGPMGILYGHKLDRQAGEDAGRFHISIGYSF